MKRNEKYLDKSGNVPEEAQEIISKNSEYIIKYAEMYDVDPYEVAGCIYVEQVTNVDWMDSLDSTIAIKTDSVCKKFFATASFCVYKRY